MKKLFVLIAQYIEVFLYKINDKMAFIMIDVPDSKRGFYKQILSAFREVSVLNEDVDVDSIFTPQFIEKLDKRKEEKTYTLDELRQRIKAKYQEYGL